ncbi:hypothetical protein B0H13DRAFT_1872247 [Mycena leptocephala]|nr:hypothetical protein B0H13DRAFT_1872247 [Mycena leptocephala]
MSGSGRKRKSSNAGTHTSKAKKQRSKTAHGKQPAASGSSGQAGGAGGAVAVEWVGLEVVEILLRTVMCALQRHIRMACGLLTADVVLGPADNYIDHYNKRFDDVADMEAHMRTLVAEVKKPNREAFKRVERLIKDVKGQIAKDIAMIPAEHIAFVFGAITCVGLKTFHPDVFGPTHSTYNQLHRHLAISTFHSLVSWYGYTALAASTVVASDYHLLADLYDNYVFGTIKTNSRKEFNTPGSLGKAQRKSNAEKRRMRLCERRYKEAKSMRYRKPILRMMKVEATHSDDECPAGGDARKNRGLLVHTKEGRNPIVTAFVYEQDRKIAKRQERSPTKSFYSSQYAMPVLCGLSIPHISYGFLQKVKVIYRRFVNLQCAWTNYVD